MDTTFCQKRIISHASLATTLILYLVVWSSWANTAQGWLSQPSPCPEGPQAVPDCSGTGGKQGHCWISLGALHFPPPLLDGVFVLVLGVSQQNTEAPHCSTNWTLIQGMFPFPGSTFPWNTDLTAPQVHFPSSFTQAMYPPTMWARTPCQRVKTTHLASFLLLPYQQAHYLCKEKKMFNWCDTLHRWQAHTK